MTDKEITIPEDKNFKIELKQSAKGDWYTGSIRAKADTIEEIEVAIKQLKEVAEKNIN